MTFTQSFIVEGRYLGQASRGLLSVAGGAIVPPSYAFFCGDCADLWARCPVETPRSLSQCDWMVWKRPCRRCLTSRGGGIPGSLMLPWEPDFNQALLTAADAVEWEFNRHLEWAERKQL